MSNYRLYGDAKASAKEGDRLRKDRSLQAAQKGFQDNPTTPNQMALATALFDVGRFAEAEKLLKDIADSPSVDENVLSELGFTYKNLGRKQEAVDTFKRLVSRSPKHPLALSAEDELWKMDPGYTPSWIKK
jgi:Flp pilus assembly protein TadD